MKTTLRSSVALMALVLLASHTTINDTDFFWHLATGRWIWEHARVPKMDPFSFTFYGRPWMDITWGYEVLLYTASRIAGYAGTTVFHSLLAGGALVLSWLSACLLIDRVQDPLRQSVAGKSREKSSLQAVTLDRPSRAALERLFGFSALILLLPIISSRWVPRPETCSQILSAAFILVLVKAFQEHRGFRFLLLLPVLQLIWVNTHGMFVLGIALAGAAWISCLFKAPSQPYPDRLPMTMILILVVLACLVNPRGLAGASYPLNLYEVTQNPMFTRTIGEGNPAWNTLQGQIFWGILAVLGLMSWRAGRRALGEGYSVLLLFTLYFGELMLRNIIQAYFLILPFALLALARGLHGWLFPKLLPVLSRLGAAQVIRRVTFVPVFLSLLFAAGMWTNLFRLNKGLLTGLGLTPFTLPEKACRYLIEKNLVEARTFADSDFTNQMLWEDARFRPYIDSRYVEVYSPEHYRRQIAILETPSQFTSEDAAYDFQAVVILHPSTIWRSFLFWILGVPDWRLVYLDEVSTIFLKKGYREDIPPMPASALEPVLRQAHAILQEASLLTGFHAMAAQGLSQFIAGLNITGHTEEALEVADLLMKTAPSYGPGLDAACSAQYNALAKKGRLKEEDLRKIEPVCRAAMGRGKSTSGLYYVGMICSLTGRFTEAADCFQKLMVLDPKNPDLPYLVAHHLALSPSASQGSYRIHELYLKSVEMNPLLPARWIELASFAERVLANPGLAAGYYQRALELAPDPALAQHIQSLRK